MGHRGLGKWLSQGIEWQAGAQGCGDRWKVGLLYGCDLAWSEMREMQKGFSLEVRLRRDMGLFQWKRGQLGREDGGIKKEWDRGNGNRVWTGRWPSEGAPAAWWSRRRKVWAGEKVRALAGPSYLFPDISSLLTGALPVYSCSKSGEDFEEVLHFENILYVNIEPFIFKLSENILNAALIYVK